MGYRDQFQPASFRGISFFVDTSDMDFGRRTILHEYPLRDVPYAEDLGQKPRRFTISAYVTIGPQNDDYLPQRDRLIEAIERNKTAGTLVHPTLGSMQVIPESCRVRFSNREGGIEYFELSFAQAGENKYPDTSANSKAKVLSSSSTAKEASVTLFASQVDTTQRPEYLRTEIIDRGNDLLKAVNTSMQGYPVSESETWVDSLATFTTSITALVSNPAAYSQSVSDFMDSIRAVYTTAQDAYAVFEGLLTYGDTLPDIPLTTENRRQQKINRDNHVRLVKRHALINMAEAATDITFDSYDDAVATRNLLAERLDDEILVSGATDDDEALNALETLRADMVADITQRGADLKKIRTIQLKQSKPALVLSYDLYATPNSETDIINRNRVNHPGFVPGGQPIEVLSA